MDTSKLGDRIRVRSRVDHDGSAQIEVNVKDGQRRLNQLENQGFRHGEGSGAVMTTPTWGRVRCCHDHTDMGKGRVLS